MNTPSSRFLSYEEGFNNSRSIVLRGFKRIESEGSEKAFTNAIDVESELSEAEAYLEAMSAELKGMVQIEKSKFQPRVARQRDELNSLSNKLAILLKSAEQELASNPSSSRNKMLQANSRLDKSTNLLNESMSIVHQTDAVGAQTIEDLERQKKELNSARDYVDDTHGIMYNAKLVLNEMTNRAIRHKLCLAFTIVLLAGLNGVVIYYGFHINDKNKK